MSDEPECVHAWGEAELCETRFGNFTSPTCRYCGAVKLELDRRRVPTTFKPRPIPEKVIAAIGGLAREEMKTLECVSTNIPRRNVAVHPFQTEFFTNT